MWYVCRHHLLLAENVWLEAQWGKAAFWFWFFGFYFAFIISLVSWVWLVVWIHMTTGPIPCDCIIWCCSCCYWYFLMQIIVGFLQRKDNMDPIHGMLVRLSGQLLPLLHLCAWTRCKRCWPFLDWQSVAYARNTKYEDIHMPTDLVLSLQCSLLFLALHSSGVARCCFIRFSCY